MDRWNIVIARGATYRQSITVTGVADIASATLWRVKIAMTDGSVVNATTTNGMIEPGTGSNNKVLSLDPATTAAMTLGNGRFDFDIEWSLGATIVRYVSNGNVQVNPAAEE